LPWRTAVGIGAEVASALAAVHARGLVHRDIKPANVMLTASGAKLVDFGISAIAGDRSDNGTAGLLGTPAYLAPERLSGAPTAPATDVYALGILLYTTLSGQYPWDADTPAMMLSAHKHRPPKPLPDIKDLPRSVVRLTRRCLAKSPADRPTAEEVAGELYRAHGAKSRKAGIRAGAALVGATAATLVFFTSFVDRDGTQPTAQAAAGGEAAQMALAGAPIGCLVKYTTTAQSGGTFTADLAVTNTGKATAGNWQLKFRMTNGQVLRPPVAGRLRQQGAEVVLTDPARPQLSPGGALDFALSGQYNVVNPLPTDFTLNGVACQQVLMVNTPAPATVSGSDTGDGNGSEINNDDHGKGKKHGKD
jgi:serine/threonine-protein kinase